MTSNGTCCFSFRNGIFRVWYSVLDHKEQLGCGLGRKGSLVKHNTFVRGQLCTFCWSTIGFGCSGIYAGKTWHKVKCYQLLSIWIPWWKCFLSTFFSGGSIIFAFWTCGTSVKCMSVRLDAISFFAGILLGLPRRWHLRSEPRLYVCCCQLTGATPEDHKSLWSQRWFSMQCFLFCCDHVTTYLVEHLFGLRISFRLFHHLLPTLSFHFEIKILLPSLNKQQDCLLKKSNKPLFLICCQLKTNQTSTMTPDPDPSLM